MNSDSAKDPATSSTINLSNTCQDKFGAGKSVAWHLSKCWQHLQTRQLSYFYNEKLIWCKITANQIEKQFVLNLFLNNCNLFSSCFLCFCRLISLFGISSVTIFMLSPLTVSNCINRLIPHPTGRMMKLLDKGRRPTTDVTDMPYGYIGVLVHGRVSNSIRKHHNNYCLFNNKAKIERHKAQQDASHRRWLWYLAAIGH